MPDIKLKGWSGNEFEYEGVPFVWLADPSQEIKDLEEGEEANLIPFTYGEAVSKSVAPDFSGGDMAVLIPEGELVNDLTIVKPEELVPENIAEGIYIAGVGPGTYRGGGDGLDTSDPLLSYYVYQLNNAKREILICAILIDLWYADTGTYDITIPATLGGYNVVIAPEGV